MLTSEQVMPTVYMTPEQVVARLISERVILKDNAKEVQRQVIDREAKARRKIEDIEIGLKCEKI